MKAEQSPRASVCDSTFIDSWQTMFACFITPALLCNRQGGLLGINQAFCAVLGFEWHDLAEKNFLDLLENDEPFPGKKGDTDIFVHCCGNNSTLAAKLRTGRNDVLVMEIEVNAVAGGYTLLCRPSAGNIADLAALRQSEAQLRAIANSTKDAILMMDQNGLISFWNPAATVIFGYEESEAVGGNLHRLLAPTRYHRQHTAAFSRFQRSGLGMAIDRTLELQARHRDGHEIAIELSLSKLEVDGAWHTIGIVRDITSRKLAEQELKESEERFRALHNASFGGIAIHDNGLIIDCNQELATITGYGPEELRGMNGLLLVAEECRDDVIEKISTGYDATYEIEGVRKDGSRYPVQLRGSNVPYRGKIVRVTEFRDISKQKQLEAQLVQAQKMEAIGTLAGGVAHDFNNVLSAILGYVDLSRNMTPEHSPAAKHLDKALQGIHRATLLVRQILSFSRQSSSKREALAVVPIVKEAIKLLRPLLPTTIEITLLIKEPVKSVVADPTQFHQIIMNLCTNAFHAMEESGGTLSISLGSTWRSKDRGPLPSIVTAKEYVLLEISDTGCGMSPEVKERIFDPYYTTKTVGKGSGMGLAIVHGLVKDYGGIIEVESTLGKGTLFRLFFPSVDLLGNSGDSQEQEVVGGNERILLVDDEEMVAEMSRSVLEHLGYQVTVFTSSSQAVAAFLANPQAFDLVITDQTMPSMTGVDLAKQILEIVPGFPVIICTGYSNKISEDTSREIGIRGFAMKPLALRDIAALIRTILDREKE